MARGCIFCGTSPTTNAHIFRKAWVDQIFPGTDALQHRHVRRGPDGFERAWAKGEADLKVNCACAVCNSGWMDALDRETEELFTNHAATGYSVKLSKQAEQKTLARWCALIAVLFDQAQATPVVEARAHRKIFDGELPDQASIWTLRTEPPAWTVSAWGEPRGWQLASPSNGISNAYFVTFGVSHFIAQVFIPTEATPEGVGLDRSTNASILRQLWPPSLTPFLWPPPQTVPWDTLSDLAEAFQKP